MAGLHQPRPLDQYSPYWNYRAELTVQDGLLLKNSRIVIPSCMRLEILDKIHAGHQGIVKCRERAKNSVWWPGLSKQLEDIVRTCTICVQELSNRAEPLITTPLPDRPWQKVAADLCEYRGNKYLVVVDYFSRYVEVEKLPLWGDKVSMLTDIYPHKPWRNIEVTICKITRLTAHFMCGLMSHLLICTCL